MTKKTTCRPCLKWNNDQSICGRYAIDSERIGDEPRMYYVWIQNEEGAGQMGHRWRNQELGPYRTKKEAKVAASTHAAGREGEEKVGFDDRGYAVISQNRETTLTGCHCCQRGYPPAEMFYLPQFTLCPECVAEMMTLLLRPLSPGVIEAHLKDARRRDRMKP